MHTVADPLRRAVQIAANRVAVVDGHKSFTYEEFQRRCERLAGGLLALGLEKGDRVALLMGNCHQYLECYVGIPGCGLIMVALSTRHTEPELRYTLEDSGAKVLITDRDPGGSADTCDHIIFIGDQYEALLSAEPVVLGRGVSENDVAGLFYTGGTTGKSKGVMMTHRNLIANTNHHLSLVPQSEQDAALVMAPLFHAAGQNGVLACIWMGSKMVTLGSFDAEKALDIMEREKIAMTLGVPTMLAAIAEAQLANPRDVSSMRAVLHGGSPIATEVIRRTSMALPHVELIHMYGATELAPLATALRNEQKLLDEPIIRSCGQSFPGTEVRILDSDGGECPRGEIGEIVVRGPNVMKGYWNKPEETAAVLKDGCYWTGDLGYMDDRGYVFLVDRSKDMIVTGGENVYSTEVEDILYKHPAILEAAVFGIPHEKWGEAVHAEVVLREGCQGVSKSDLTVHCSGWIAGYKVPKDIVFRDRPLPKSGAGKILKKDLRAPYWEGTSRAVN